MTEHPSHESGDVDMGALCQIDLSKQPENQWLPKDYGFSGKYHVFINAWNTHTNPLLIRNPIKVSTFLGTLPINNR